MKRVAIIMAGGSGERFWPLSTPDHPKQLLDLTGSGKSMLQESVDRIAPLVGDQVYVSTSLRLQNAIEQSGVVSEGHVLAEPEKRNTLGALIWAIGKLVNLHKTENLLISILTADHVIRPQDRFLQTVSTALAIAENESGLVTIGIRPDRPETGYGYIECGEGSLVKTFREKPDLETATKFFQSGDFLWNSGMFFWSAKVFSQQLLQVDPEAHEVFMAIASGDEDGAKKFQSLRSVSVDYGLMEKASNVHVVPSDFEWDDVGAWDSLRRTTQRDAYGNVTIGPSTVLDSHEMIIYNNTNDLEIFAMGLEGICIVVEDGKLAVFKAADSQDVRRLANLDSKS